MRGGRWWVAALGLLAVDGAGLIYVTTQAPPELGQLLTVPPAASVSVRVGDRVDFSAAAEGATGFLWSLAEAPVALGPTWSYAPRPADPGRKQVGVVVTGANGAQLIRRWDVNVMRAMPPELVDVSPPTRILGCAVGERVEFRCSALARAAAGGGRLRFKWTVDDGVMRREERSGAAAASVYAIGAEAPGMHRVAVRVSDGTGTPAIAAWTVEVRLPAPEPAPPMATAAAEPPLGLSSGPSAIDHVAGEPSRGPEEVPRPSHPTIDRRRVREDPVPRRASDPIAGRQRIAARSGREPERETGIVDAEEPPRLRSEFAPITPSPASVAAAPLLDEEVRHWLDEYARAWSRKDTAALRRMGQVRTAEGAASLERYFRSVGDLHVDVRVRALRIEGARAVVELERVDTITDPAGRRRELRLPPLTKELVRTAAGLSLVDESRSRGEGGNEIRSARGE